MAISQTLPTLSSNVVLWTLVVLDFRSGDGHFGPRQAGEIVGHRLEICF